MNCNYCISLLIRRSAYKSTPEFEAEKMSRIQDPHISQLFIWCDHESTVHVVRLAVNMLCVVQQYQCDT